MLKVPEGTVYNRGKKLSKKTVYFLINVFADRIRILNLVHKESDSHNHKWLYDQPSFDESAIVEINKILKKIGLILSETNKNVNALICYRQVDPHIDDKINVTNNSVVFIPLYGHEGAYFIGGAGENKKKIPISDGSLVVFDQNTEHSVEFPSKAKIKFGLSFFVDRL